MKVYIYCKSIADVDLEVLVKTAEKFTSEHQLSVYKKVKDQSALRSSTFTSMLKDILSGNVDLLVIGDKEFMGEIEAELVSMVCNYVGVIVRWL